MNKQTIKNKYLFPLGRYCFHKLKVFSKLDLCQGYYQVIILEGEATKKTCMTKYGIFEFPVTLFNLCIALETFGTLKKVEFPVTFPNLQKG